MRLKKRNKNAGSNKYDLQLELFSDDPDIKKYTSNGKGIKRSKYRKYTSYETRKENSYGTDKSNLEVYLSFAKNFLSIADEDDGGDAPPPIHHQREV